MNIGIIYQSVLLTILLITILQMLQKEYIGNNETYLERSLGFLIIGIIGIVSNSFAIFILGSSPKIRRKLVNTLIIHQSFVDLLASIALVGMAHLAGSDLHGLEGLHAQVYCFFISGKWPLWVMMDISSFGLMFLNVERYISIVYPIFHHTKVTRKKVVSLLPIIWFLGLLEQCLVSMSFKSENGACAFGSPQMFEFTVMTFLALHFFLPLALVIFLYGHMLISLGKKGTSGNDLTSNNRNELIEKARNNVFKTMLLITICYGICYVFNSIYVLLVTRGILKDFSGKCHLENNFIINDVEHHYNL